MTLTWQWLAMFIYVVFLGDNSNTHV